MLTKHEINALNLSPTKKDFVQIWNELLDVAGKLSERWDPTSTNESDPGIVLLKALTGIADKLNYNIDKNTLEAFMPTAAQEDSMRKLCEMLGYNIKYYQSAKTEVTIKYHNSDPTEEEAEAIKLGLFIPKFTVITNSDKDINYFTVNTTPIYIAAETPSQIIECMEGQIVKCESINDNNIITANQIDENNRFYLPETQIAENGIFVYNIFYNNEPSKGNLGLDDGTPWTKVDNLNVCRRGDRVFKFGYDSYESRPYIEFPDDYGDLFNDGLFIYYARTNGMHGNISAHTLTQLEAPNMQNWDKVPVESFSVDNIFAATSGTHIETIKQAYNNFKKTVGTFETLVTCRDYMNKIYAMTNSVGKPYISNILVTDMRNDLNRALTICSCDDAGIFYKERPIIELKEVVHKTTDGISVENLATKPVFASENSWEDAAWRLGSATGPKLLSGSWITGTIDNSNLEFDYTKDGKVHSNATYAYWLVDQKVGENENYTTFVTNLACRIEKEDQVTKIEKEWTSTPLINHFDLVFYPYKSYNQIKSEVKDVRSVYDNSFNYTNIGFKDIKARLEADQLKTISHNIITPRHSNDDYVGDIVSINNYLRLNATIATNTKITVDEGNILKHKIKAALSNAFNMRELDFGEEIPFESIVEVIENADSRIKVASLNEPALYTTYSVFDHVDDYSGHPVIVEYAVASDYLSLEDADKSDRFTGTTATGAPKNTFDTNEARKIYNKLLLRNILAGRVALFKYNNTFDTNFNEAPYQETTVYPKNPDHASILSLARPGSFPAGLENPSADNPYTIYTENGVTYTARQYDDNSLIKYEFAESKTPELFTGNVIAHANGNDITKITPFCHIAINDGCIPGEGREKLVLSDGETIKFRAPNFTTVKTYPAYVNYHLSLKEELDNNGEAVAAEAESLFSVLDSDRESWSSSNTGVKWQKVIDYFRSVDVNNRLTKTPTEYVQTFTLSQEVSKFTQAASSGEDACPVNESGEHVINPTTNTCRYCGTPMFSQVQKGAIVVDIKNNEAEEKDVEGLFAKSGCVKLTNKCIKLDATTGKYLFRAKLLWKPADGETAPPGEGPDLDIDIGLRSPFISDIGTLSNIKELVNTALEEHRNMVKDDGITPVLPSECSWCITFDFECVPFEPASLNEWNKFIKLCAQSEGGNYGSILSYKPIEELGTVFWRAFGEGYQIGKYIQANSQKLLKFDKNYFGLLPQTAYMTGIYLAKSLGQDASPHIIHNLEEYRLQSGEYLFIEYTPSSTTEDGTTQDLPPVTEILGEGTIIRPGGFEVGLLDSDVLSSQGTSAHKTVSFLMPDGSAQEIAMHRFGANEQVEIRDLAKVELSKDTFKSSSSTVWIYKNFNDCPELETLGGADSDSIRTYTLKDGEFIFYTDQNKSELAYFGSGTEVQLHGNVVLPKCELVDLVDVFDSSIEEIPWEYLPFERSNQKIIFQEFQYITIGNKDTVENITVLGATQPYLDSEWLFCSDVSYKLAGEENPKSLPRVSIPGRAGDGWEVCSVLDISVSPSDAQVLRYVPDVVETGLKLSGNSQGGGDADEVEVSPKNENQVENSLAFKSNLACQALSNNSVYLSDIYNQNKLTGFKFKFFADEPIALVKTKLGKVVPNTGEAYTSWKGEPIAAKDYLDIWNQVGLDKIKVEAEDGAFDNALRLSVCTIPGTYGIVCIYINYTSTDAITNARTWIETLPGTSADAIKIFNGTNGWENESGAISSSFISEGDRLYLSEGINCVRINKTGQLFIKTSEGSQGVLMFDDLKLVDCESISYKNTANEDKTIPTYGLNLKQLHYLPIRTAGNILDNKVRARLEKALCDDLFKETDKMLLELNKTIKTNVDHFTTDYTNIEKISDDFVHLNALSDDAYETLVATHSDLTLAIAKETALLDNLTAKTVENELLNLISQYASADISEAQLLEELAKLKTQIASALKNRTAEQSLESFESTITNLKLSNEITSTFNDAKEITVQKLDKDLLSQVTDLVSELERVAATDEKTRIGEALNKLQTASKNSNIVDVKILLNKIANSADINDITSLITDMTISHSNKEYTTLAAQATSLRGIITSRNVLFYVEELNNAIANGNSQASALADELKTIITEENTIVSNIDALITRCGTTPVNATNIKSSFDAIVSGVNALYTNKLSNLVNGVSGTDSLKTEVDAVFSNNDVADDTVAAINNVIDQLDANANADVVAIANKIKGLLENYNSDISTFKDLTATAATWTAIKANKYFEVLSSTLSILWLQALQKAWLAKFNVVELSTRMLIKGGQTTATDIKTAESSTKSAINAYSTAFAPYDQDILGIDGLNGIVEAACIKTKTAIQNNNTISTLKALSTVVGFDGMINAAKNDFAENNKNIILTGLLQDFVVCTDVHKKANLIAQIKAELTKLKASDEQLLKFIEKELFNNIYEILSKYKDVDEETRAKIFEYYFTTNIRSNILAKMTKAELTTAGYDRAFNIVKTGIPLLVKDGLTATETASLNSLKTSALLSDEDRGKIIEVVELRRIKLLINTINQGLISDDTTDKRVFIDNTLKTIKDGTDTEVDLKKLLETLRGDLNEIALKSVDTNESLEVLTIEEQLLKDLINMDVYKEFYYTAPIETHLAIEFIGNKDSEKTMMNPATNYDINNVNNSFVISKIDIDYLDEGISLARASRLN